MATAEEGEDGTVRGDADGQGWLYMVCSSISGLRHFSGWTTGHGARHVILQLNVKGNGSYVNAACVEMEFGWTESRGEPRSQGGLSGGVVVRPLYG